MQWRRAWRRYLAGLPLGSSGAAREPAAADLATTLGIDPSAPTPTPAALNAALANSLRAIEDGERDMPRDRWDPAYVAEALGPDPQQVFAWVQANTSWIPYKGLLRGPVGVLMDRLGNSLDRALLLATLLRQPNRSVRLAHGTLSEEQAFELLPDLLILRHGGRFEPPEQGDDSLSSVAATYQLDEVSVRRTLVAQADSWERKRTQLRERAPEQARRLAAAVGRPQADQADAVLRSAVDVVLRSAVDALRDHWWVQMLDGGTWVDLDLVSHAAAASLTAADRTLDPENVPDDLRHRVMLRVIAEQWSNGVLTERVALERMLRPSNLIGVPVVLSFIPGNWPKAFPLANMSPAQSVRALALDQREWTPTLTVGKTPYTRSTIRESGDLGAGPELTGGGGLAGFGSALEDALGPSASSPAPGPRPPGSTVLTSAVLGTKSSCPAPSRGRSGVPCSTASAPPHARPVRCPRRISTNRRSSLDTWP